MEVMLSEKNKNLFVIKGFEYGFQKKKYRGTFDLYKNKMQIVFKNK
jgi:hypothetical protein